MNARLGGWAGQRMAESNRVQPSPNDWTAKKWVFLMNSKQQIKRVEKPWGFELIWAKTSDYVGKIIHINKGHKLSLQYHRIKEETVYVLSGKMILVYENDKGVLEEILLSAGEAHHIPVGRKHRFVGVEDCDLAEVSTPQLDDVVRLEDGYGRSGTSAP